jgi:uncharacterized protein YoxC
MVNVSIVWLVILITAFVVNLIGTIFTRFNDIRHIKDDVKHINEKLTDLYEKFNVLNADVNYLKGKANGRIQ